MIRYIPAETVTITVTMHSYTFFKVNCYEQRAKIGVANYFKDFSAVLAKTFGWWEKINNF